MAEALLYYADRRIHMQQKVLPALEKGSWVISDRFADSTMAYQYYGYNKRVPKQMLDDLYKMTVGDFYPDLTVILDIDPEIGLARSMAQNSTYVVQETRHESREMEFHRNLRQGFLEIAKTADRYAVIDANKTIESLHDEIVNLIEERLL